VQFNPEATYDAALSHLESLFKGSSTTKAHILLWTLPKALLLV